MIELLIVIAVMGILAVAVLAAINPIEQINRGRDTGSRSDAEQLISGSDRYYASKGYYPWMVDAVSTNTSTFPVSPGFVVLNAPGITVGADAEPMLSNLSAAGTEELKASFTSRITNSSQSNLLSIYNDGVSGSSTYVCFVPKSSAFREEAWNRCTNSTHTGISTTLPVDFPPGACPAGGTCSTAATSNAATGCYICLP